MEKKSLFDRLHDGKAGTPVGGGILIIAVVTALFAILLPLITYMGRLYTKLLLFG